LIYYLLAVALLMVLPYLVIKGMYILGYSFAKGKIKANFDAVKEFEKKERNNEVQ
jgi:hypothetical protein